MATKAQKENKKQQENKNVIVGVIAAVVVLLVAVILIVVASNRGLNESYFVSDDRKYVFTLSADEAGMSNGGGAGSVPAKVYAVYDYSGDKVTGMRIYCEYEDAKKAKTAYDYAMKDMDEESMSSYRAVRVDGKYLIWEMEKSRYEDLKASTLKGMIENAEETSGDGGWEGWAESTEWGNIEEEEPDGNGNPQGDKEKKPNNNAN